MFQQTLNYLVQHSVLPSVPVVVTTCYCVYYLALTKLELEEGKKETNKKTLRDRKENKKKKNHKILFYTQLYTTESCQLKVFTYLVHFLLKYFITYHVQGKESKTFVF